MRPMLAALSLLLLATATPARADQASALAAVRSQPRVLDATIDNRGNLYVVVKNDNAVNWTQYAALLCQLVRPHQAMVFQTHVVDLLSVGKGAKPNEWKALGTVNCAAVK